MKKSILALGLCLLLTGCGSLLDRSYTVVEPYSARFWDTGAEDTLKAESYQDLVNSLLMLVEQRSEEGHIRFYGKDEASAYLLAAAAAQEVRKDTMLGSYLLSGISFTHEASETYSTITYAMSYRQMAEDPDSIMKLRDPQSLTDLLRLAEREKHQRLTARFVYEVPRREVEAVVEPLWQELCRSTEDLIGQSMAQAEEEGTEEADAGEELPEEMVTSPDDPAPGEPASPGPAPTDPEEAAQDGGEELQDEPVDERAYPPCPWEIRFYPDRERAEMVEITLD